MKLEGRPHIPLKIVRPRVFVLAVGTEGTSISWRLMHESMSDHLVLSLEAFSAFGASAAFDRAEMGSVLRVNIGVGTKNSQWNASMVLRAADALQEVLCLERLRGATIVRALEPTRYRTVRRS